MMNKEQFFSFMKYSVQDLLNERGVDGEVELQEVIKNNDRALTGLVIHGNGETISPCVYLDDMYERYQGVFLFSIWQMRLPIFWRIPEIQRSI